MNLCESVAVRKRQAFLSAGHNDLSVHRHRQLAGHTAGVRDHRAIETLDEIVYHKEHKGEEVHLDEIHLQLFSGSGPVGVLLPGSIDDDIAGYELDEEALKAQGKQAGILVPFLRSANTDVNTTLAIALVAMFMVHFWGFSALGFFGHVGKFITIRGGPIGLFVGILELISEVARLISFTFRLFGNIFAGEVLLIAMGFLVPLGGNHSIPRLGAIRGDDPSLHLFNADPRVRHDGDREPRRRGALGRACFEFRRVTSSRRS